MEREEVTIPVDDAGLSHVTQRSLTSFGMTAFSAATHCANPGKFVIPNEVRDLSLPPRRERSRTWKSPAITLVYDGLEGRRDP